MNHCHLGIGPLRDSVDEFHHGSYRRSHDQLTEGSLTAPRVWTSPLQRGRGTARNESIDSSEAVPGPAALAK